MTVVETLRVFGVDARVPRSGPDDALGRGAEGIPIRREGDTHRGHEEIGTEPDFDRLSGHQERLIWVRERQERLRVRVLGSTEGL